MGTLFNQLPRKKHQVEFLDLMAAADDIKKVAEESELKTETVAEIYKAEALNRFTECYRAVAKAVETKPEGELP